MSVVVFCDFRLLKFTMRKNILNTVWVSVVFSKRDFPPVGSWQRILLIIIPIYAMTFVAKDANKL